ncbi:succinate dehydrogenase assembly factor 4, mitochondrial isoform X1 [Erpetoichthys calabaricus]|uniref:Succinate dehydrogenase assembly factor 4, mitochondrial n=1 Tax=Erpetoichthys calabaricus TaxID=27687 RepID=A0A8C4T434_ERPCA|nr:succinate dehydrogenase assembly factor 4, mitochondrial isoform X1 [Erpetoichthys calabaricus]
MSFSRTAMSLTSLFSFASKWRLCRCTTGDLIFCNVVHIAPLRHKSSMTDGKNEAKKGQLKTPKTPLGRYDDSSQDSAEKEPLQKFPDDVNPVTKEKGGPRGPEPTRYGDWERKGRCIDF